MSPREDTMVCMDNSEWMRNGDYARTRFEAQYQAIEFVLRSKTANVENTVGLLSLAGGANVGVQVLCSPTTEKFKVGRAASSAKIGGKADLATGLRVAQLALKYRANRQVQARIVVFIGSPIDAEKSKLVKIAKQLKKSNIAVDVVSMGEIEENDIKLNAFIKEVSKNDPNVPCTLLQVERGAYPEDVIQNSPMGGGIQEEDDPLLHMALQASLAESRENASAPPIPPQAAAAPVSSTVHDDDEDMDEEERAMLEQAKLMSMMQDEPKSSKDTADASSLLDSNLLSDMLEKAGADPNDPDIKKALEEVNKKDKKDDKDDEKK